MAVKSGNFTWEYFISYSAAFPNRKSLQLLLAMLGFLLWRIPEPQKSATFAGNALTPRI
jgi:hypothetical protein